MKRNTLLLLSSFCLLPSAFLHAASTISAEQTNQVSYGANIGWMNWYADNTNGVAVGEYVLAGHIWSANVGWIHLGTGSPTNGVTYSNTSTNDYGVNHLGTGELRGYAYGANIGWIIFTNATAGGPLLSTEVPRFDLATGRFRGYAYSANCGWIALSNDFAAVQTVTLAPGTDTDGDGIPDAWELEQTGNLVTLTASGDADGDGVTDRNEYQADTDPLDSNDLLRIIAYSANSAGSTSTVTWTSRPTRLYRVQSRDSLTSGNWTTNTPPGLVSADGATTTRDVPGTATSNRFFRVQGLLPLAP